MDPLLRLVMVAQYGEQNVAELEAAPRPDAPMTEAETATELHRIRDKAEAARFAAEIERDAALGDGANWPHE